MWSSSFNNRQSHPAHSGIRSSIKQEAPCIVISKRADEIVRDDETFNDKDQPINYRPAKPKPERDRQQSMESLYNEEDEGLDLNHEDEGVHHNKYEDDEAQEGDDEFQRLLEKNEQDLQQAMKRLHKLHKKRSNITKAHLARKKIK